MKKYHQKNNKKWYAPYINKQPSPNLAIRDAIKKWEQENGRKFRRALLNKQ